MLSFHSSAEKNTFVSDAHTFPFTLRQYESKQQQKQQQQQWFGKKWKHNAHFGLLKILIYVCMVCHTEKKNELITSSLESYINQMRHHVSCFDQ